MLGIAHGSQHTGAVVVQHRYRNSQKYNPDVKLCIRVQLLRCIDELQKRTCNQRCYDCKHYADHNAQKCTVCQISAQILGILRTEGLCHRNTEAHARSLNKAQNQKIQRIGCSHRAQGIGAKASPDNYCICEAVQLLEQGSKNQRQCKQ